ncbi:hypothetical protein C1879_05385 [Paraeggerthella hongkongensis]|uniref:zinc-ribbon domain-containing protein n=1 Tax=Paraeggerthella sp. TaxID=2897350 RepID=UPI000DF84AB0|nr:hypothetical protein C1879_05385 [Paraeggerthella hongkongensis]
MIASNRLRRHWIKKREGVAMFCRACGREIQDGAAFCRHCGSPTGLAKAVPSGVGELERLAMMEEEAERNRNREVAEREARLNADRSLRAAKSRFAFCFLTGLALAAAVGVFAFYVWTNYSTTPDQLAFAPFAAAVGALGCFFLPFGVSVLLSFCRDKGISLVLFWVLGFFIYPVALVAGALVGIPGVFIMGLQAMKAK